MTTSELKRFALFAECSDEEREAIVELLEERVLRSGSPLYREGGEAEGLVLVAEGALRLESRRAGPLGRVTAGGSLGGAAIVAAGKREVTAIAEGRTRVWILERTAFRRLVEDSPRAACRVAEAVLAHLAGAVRDVLGRLVASG